MYFDKQRIKKREIVLSSCKIEMKLMYDAF